MQRFFTEKMVYAVAGAIGLFAIITPWHHHYELDAKWPTVKNVSGEEVFLDNGTTLHVSAKAYTAEESKKYLKKDLINKGIQPVQITIQNNSSQAFSLSSGSVDLNSVEASTVAKKFMMNAVPRSIALKVASFLFWPFLVPDTINTIVTLKSYQTLKKDLDSKTIKKEVVAPYSIFNRVVFVPTKDIKESFDVTLIDIETLAPIVVHIKDLPLTQEGMAEGTDVAADTAVKPASPVRHAG